MMGLINIIAQTVLVALAAYDGWIQQDYGRACFTLLLVTAFTVVRWEIDRVSKDNR